MSVGRFDVWVISLSFYIKCKLVYRKMFLLNYWWQNVFFFVGYFHIASSRAVPCNTGSKLIFRLSVLRIDVISSLEVRKVELMYFLCQDVKIFPWICTIVLEININETSYIKIKQKQQKRQAYRWERFIPGNLGKSWWNYYFKCVAFSISLIGITRLSLIK